MEITTYKEDDVTIFAIVGRMDASNASEFETVVNKEVEEGANKFVVDLSKLEYISSAGLRSMLLLAKATKKNGGSSVLSGLTSIVAEVFRISGFLTIFKAYDTLEEAIQS